MVQLDIPWAHCEIVFVVRHRVDMHALGLCEELPLGWVVSTMTDDPFRRGYRISFDVQGEATVRDGILVSRILQRMGAAPFDVKTTPVEEGFHDEQRCARRR